MGLGFEKHYEAGDVVEIVTPEEFRARGGSCTSDCAIAQYFGSICEVVKVTIPGVVLSPIKEVRNFQKESEMPISHFAWSYPSVKRYKGDVTLDIEKEFDAVFA